jgi:hypothetical protein
MEARFPRVAFIATSLLWTWNLASRDDTPKPVTQPHERAQIQAWLEKSAPFAEAVKNKNKVIACTMTRYLEKPEGTATKLEFMEALHFDYDTGKTIRSICNEREHKVVKIETLEAYPTPLAAEELALATKLAKEKDERAKVLFKKYNQEQITVEALAPVISDRKNKNFGKRLAILIFSPKKKLRDTVSVTINLTDETVSVD